MPKHGEERNRETKKHWSSMEYVGEDGKRFSVKYPSSEITISERYCEHCKRWVPCDTVISHLICKDCLADW